MKMAPRAIPNPGRVLEQELLSPELGFLVAAELGNFSGEILRVSPFLGEKRLYRRRGDARRWRRLPGGTQVRSRLDRGQGSPGGCGPPRSSPSGSWGLQAKKNLCIFWEFSKHFGFWTFSTMHRHNKQKLALVILSIGYSKKICQNDV